MIDNDSHSPTYKQMLRPYCAVMAILYICRVCFVSKFLLWLNAAPSADVELNDS